MSPVQPTVCAVVVTYGERWQLLEQVLTGLKSQKASLSAVVVVANGTPYDLDTRLATVAPGTIGVTLHENRGSAAGYAAGIARAVALGYDLIWLLDDDNVPRPDALAQLLRARRLLGESDQYLFASLRPDRAKYLQVVYADAVLTTGRPDSFMGFSSGEIPRMLSGRLLRRRSTARPQRLAAPIKRIDYAVYGGLLFSSTWVDRVGLPDERYVLYIDDREYTTRISRAGGDIYLVATSIVDDVDRSWHVQVGAQRIPALLDPAVSEDRVFYTIRNLVWYDRCYTVRWRWRYLLNLTLFLTLQAVLALARGVAPQQLCTRLALIRTAVADGLRGRLGPRRPPLATS